jgi:hypothetical protein
MKKYSELLFSVLLLFLVINLAGAQSQQTINSTTDPKTGVRVTTIVKPLPTLTEQVSDFEIKLAEAEKDPTLVSNGTVDKYRTVLIQLRKNLEIENNERKKLESLEKK